MYDRFATVAEMRNAYAGKHGIQHFTLTDPAELARLTCADCGEPLHRDNDHHSIRCDYDPDTGEVRAKHFLCLWNDAAKAVLNLHCA